jgi:outer membrane protein OmpA-like peptidoglycan-associated protein
MTAAIATIASTAAAANPSSRICSTDAAAPLLAAAPAGQPAPGTPDDASCYSIEHSVAGRLYRELFLIFFDLDSSAVTPAMAAILDEVAIAYASVPHCIVWVYAHSDRSGASAYNLALSRRRAEAAAYLRPRGVTAAFHFGPYGGSRPLVETPDGVREPQNRRAEILLGPLPR